MSGKSLGDLEYKTLGQEFHTSSDGVVEAYATAFGLADLGDDIIHRGATERSIKSRFTDTDHPSIRVLYGHQRDKVLGHPIEIYEDDYGTMTKSQYNMETFWGNEVFQLIAGKDLTAQSIGYLPGKDVIGQKAVSIDDDGIRHLHDIELFEYGPLPFPMQGAAYIVGVKSEIDHDTSFNAIVEQAANAVQDVLIEAEELAQRRESDGRSLNNAHLESLVQLRDVAEAAVETIGKMMPAQEESSQEPVVDLSAALKLQLDLARARLRSAGITEV